MKKLMVVAATAVLAVSANAAMLDWAIMRQAWDSTAGVAFEGAAGGNVYAFLSSDLAAVQAIIDSTASGSAFDFSSIAVKDATTFTNGKGAAMGALSSDSIVAGNNYDVFFVAMSADSSQYMVSGTVSGKAYDASSAATAVTAQWDADHMVSSTAGWTAVGGGSGGGGGGGGSTIPEPTSGLLLLLGVAGLALRRKN